MRTSSRTFAILLFDEVDLLGLAGVMEVASEAGRHWNWRPFRLVPVAAEAGWVATRSQIRLEATHSLNDAPKAEILLVPGGYGARRASNDDAIVEYVRTASESAHLLVGIGAGVAVLAAAGQLGAEKVAVSAANRAWISSLAPGTHFEERPIVHEGRILTAASGADGIELGLRLVEAMLGKGLSERVRTAFGVESHRRIEVTGSSELPVAKL